MPRVPVHTIDDAPDASRDLLKRLDQTYGKVLNIHGAMAHAPALLDLAVSAENAIKEHTSLDPATRQAIHLAVAAVNECDYCQSAYTGAAKQAGFDESQTVAIRERREDEFDDELGALLNVARQIAGDKGHVDEATWRAAIDAGWSDVQLLEAYADTVRTILTNYFNHLVDTELDIPAAPGIQA